MLPKILRNFNVFVDGYSYARKIDEITLPKLTIKTEEYRAGGMDIPINIDMAWRNLKQISLFLNTIQNSLGCLAS